MRQADRLRVAIGGRLRARRRALGLTQQECALLTGLHRVTLVRIERGHRRLTLPELHALCEVLGCDAEDLLADPGLAAAATRNHARLSAAGLL